MDLKGRFRVLQVVFAWIFTFSLSMAEILATSPTSHPAATP
jgi:hypothetical protein